MKLTRRQGMKAGIVSLLAVFGIKAKTEQWATNKNINGYFVRNGIVLGRFDNPPSNGWRNLINQADQQIK